MIIKNANEFIDKVILENNEFLFDGNGPKIVGVEDLSDVHTKIDYEEIDNAVKINVCVHNKGNEDIAERISLNMGVDCCLGEFPDWNYKLFPTMLRCEKTHFYGYCMTPLGKTMGIVCDAPLASYKILYEGKENIVSSFALDMINPFDLPDRYPSNLKTLKAGESIKREIYLFSATDFDELYKRFAEYTDAPIIDASKWTIEYGEPINITDKAGVELEIYSPSGKCLKNGDTADEYGLYKVYAKKGDYCSESCIYCRKDWGFYLKEARKQSIEIPQKATTHTESWYGFFSGYLAAKHYPDPELDKITEARFCEVMPYIFDLENGEPKVITERIQNVACMISLLVDRYEADPENNAESLDIADRFFEFLASRQSESGEYLRGEKHYTCVIYIAKSVLELYLAVKDIKGYEKRAEKYYNSAKRAIDNLVLLLDDITTEGLINFFEDGMISCSALQIAMFALLLDESERQKYIDAAEIMIKKHCCLEQKNIPDCRMRVGSLRWWEAQYDIQTKPNMMNSPHGWTAWTMYAKYYLYLLTGKYDYLKDLMDGLGACVQLMTLDGKLRWAFICDPCVEANVFVKDKKLVNGYSGKHEKQLIGEQYMDLISGWFTHETQIPTGGYLGCPLFLKDKTIEVDGQGGCCDNDVHEIFKCVEETVLKKAFIHCTPDGDAICYSCKISGNEIILDDDIEALVFYSDKNMNFAVNGKEITFDANRVKVICVK